jgi:signal transduction histidine kinase/DNA-binding response OmpR family regulator
VNSEHARLENDLDEINRRMTFRINDFYHDRKGRYWLATQKDGLIMMSTDGMVFEKWTIREGLPTNTLMRIESVDDRYLWISTISGICRFDTQTFQTMVFTNRHGLPASEFNPRTSDVTENGHIIFGSTAGFTMVNPESVEPDISQTEVVISDISFHNQSIRKLAGKPILTKALEETERIVLPFRKNSFTIRFFTRDKHLPKFNNFAYRLTGFENEWIYPGETSHCTYTNLSPGKYIFEVKATNKSNIWMEKPTTLKITIKSPYYLSWYAYLFYFLLVGSVILISLQIYRNRLNLKKELEISAYKVQKEKELTEKKLSFFTNISHDLKTPLTLIDAPLNDLLQSGNLSGEQIRKLNIIRRNSKRLFNLISDLVDFRKLTQEKIPLNIRKVNIKELFDQIEEAFRVECKMKSIDLMIHITCDEWVYVDQNKLEKIVWNLMSNAVKFTPEGGEIYLGVECLQDTGSIKMTVKDTGIGIGESELKKIFDRFYQVKEKNIRYEGTGIGLSIVKELVELHKGTIHVASTPGSGTVFTVILPLGKEISSGEDEETGTENKDLIPPSEGLREVIPPGTETVSTQYNLSKLLIVEDNTELREYLASHFCRNYKVVQASDGYEGFRNAMEKNPDIILADVLMPNLDGFEFCRLIRANFDTSHIPVVMLTANSSDESRIEGISTGADAYVTKPFDISFLDALLRTLLENRRKLRDKLVDSVMPVGDKDGIHTRDAEFMGKVRAYIEKNIGDTDLTIDHLSSELGISRTQLNRKIKSLSGHTPNNLIKIIRLKKAYKLIRNQGVRVSEAAYMTGFSDPNYFTVCFRKEFGENPSQVN